MPPLRLTDFFLTDFRPTRPQHLVPQEQALEWLAKAHARAQATADRLSPEAHGDLEHSMRRRLQRFGCSPTDIQTRATVVDDCLHDRWDEMRIFDVSRSPRGQGTSARSALFAEKAGAYLDGEYADDAEPPDDIIHVTCTGYVSPSAAQEVVARRGWGERTRIVHAYHMGCYASIPAVRIAAGLAALGSRRADIVHTELCTIHMDPSDHSAEQLVVQSLFADGLIRYSLVRGAASGLEILALDEAVIPDSGDSMKWVVGEFGMHMTLGRDVPDRVAGPLRGFVARLFAEAGAELARDLSSTIFAVHPGGPKIIDRVRDVLELAEPQVAASRAVLAAHGNMSSATLPHVWARVAADPAVARGTLVASLAFGPGLTVCGGLFRKA